jgi:hypothetical protein
VEQHVPAGLLKAGAQLAVRLDACQSLLIAVGNDEACKEMKMKKRLTEPPVSQETKGEVHAQALVAHGRFKDYEFTAANQVHIVSFYLVSNSGGLGNLRLQQLAAVLEGRGKIRSGMENLKGRKC